MLTNKKRLYAQARMAGKNQTDAAIYAGCPIATAAQAGSRYEKDYEIHAHIARLRSGEPEPVVVKPEKPKKEKAVKPPKVKPEPKQKAAPVVKVKPDPAPKPVKEVYVKPVANDESLDKESDPLEYMRRVMTDPMEEPRLRLDAAKALAAYIHAKPGEKGKREQDKDKAEKSASKFIAAQPPRLVASR